MSIILTEGKKGWKNIVSAMQQSYLNIQYENPEILYLFELKMLETGSANVFKAGKHEVRQVTFEERRSGEVMSLKTDKPKKTL